MPRDEIAQYAAPSTTFPVDLDSVVSLDFETYYDTTYSLRAKAYNTSSYIRSPLFQVHCVGLKIGRGETKVYWYEEVEPALRAVDWTKHTLLCHHGQFDGLILSHHYGIVPAFYFCTLAMARALHSNQTRAGLDAISQFYGVGNKLPNVLGRMRGHRAIPPELVPDATAYTATDVDLMWTIFQAMVRVFPQRELRLIDLTIRLFTQPVFHVDLDLAREELDFERARKRELVRACGLALDPDAELTDEAIEELVGTLNSAGKLAAQLKALGIEPPMKESKRTGQQTYAFAQTDEDFIALGAHPDERVRKLVGARLGIKNTLGETRASRFLIGGADNMPLPVYLNYCGAHTTRWSGGDKLNMQNLPRGEQDERGVLMLETRRLRRAVKAPSGCRIVVCDSAQIEARVLAWLAGQTDLVAAFRNKVDVYSGMASDIYGHPVNRKQMIEVDGVKTYPDKDKGFVGKVTVLGSGYGMGWRRFQGTLALGIMGPPMEISDTVAQTAIRTYRNRYAHIPRYWRGCDDVLYQMFMKRINGKRDDYTRFGVLEYDEQTLWMPNGLGLHYPDLRGKYNPEFDRIEDFTYRSNKEFVHIWGGTLTENVCQALARIIVGEQMLEIADKWRVALMTHDEVVCVAPERRADECLEDMMRVMRTPPAWAPDLPLDAEGGHDVIYSK